MTVRIATYNLFEGAASSYNRLVEFVRTSRLDVLCLQEINGWQNNDMARLRDFTDQILFAAQAFGNSNTEYKLATVSKHAISSRHLHAEAFWHAALEVRVQFGDKEVAIVNLHLDPWKEDSRDHEIARLLSALPAGIPTIITGDFNSLSRQDNYPPELLGQLRAKGISKFGANQLEFKVIDRLLAAGFVDVFAANGNLDVTVPTAYNTDQDHEVPVRVDYMFVTPDIAPLVTAVERVKTDLTDAISDHYPLVATFTMGDKPAAPQLQPAAMPVQAPANTQAATPSRTMPPEPQLPASQPLPAWQPQPTAGAPMPTSPPPAPKPPVKPWTPEPDAGTTPAAPPPEPPKPDDGEVVMWSHDT